MPRQRLRVVATSPGTPGPRELQETGGSPSRASKGSGLRTEGPAYASWFLRGPTRAAPMGSARLHHLGTSGDVLVPVCMWGLDTPAEMPQSTPCIQRLSMDV